MKKNHSRKFKTHFQTYACEGDTITARLPGGYTATARIVRDDCSDTPDERQDGFYPSLDPKAAGYIGAKSRRTLERHTARANEVMRAWKADEWFYCGVCVTVEAHGVQLTGNYDNALWGIECNYPKHGNWRVNRYLLEVANELLGEALEQAQNKIEDLRAA